jgi:hypothetical protein
MKKKIIHIFKFLLYITIVFFGFFEIALGFLIWSATPFPLFLLVLFSIFLWLILFKNKYQWFIGIFFVFVTYFYVYFRLPSSDCGGGGNWKLGISTECKCLGVKKIIYRDIFKTDLRCIGKVTGWKNKVK